MDSPSTDNQHQEHLLSSDHEDEENQLSETHFRPEKKKTFFCLTCHFLAGALVSVAIFLVFLSPRASNFTKESTFRLWEPSSMCGSTPEEAVARGCIYDEVLLHWLPPECSSPGLIDEIVHVWPWRFWTEKAASHELTLNDVREGNQPLKWVTFGLHRWHCVATWKILSSAAQLGTTVPAFALDWNHTVHCADHVLMNRHGSGNPWVVNSHLDIEYTPCVPIERDTTMKMGATAW